ncbi:hypothetical protein PF011_g31186 [Phytophthora fragariae]|uniref:Uncharacterized protein n=1 Tax=Phytophthora fragariae TaxID=53985 RepID=A0A6A3GFT4_9STRA|nr:hypothetical protein PF011_g31186 [Phytophthora fragariae]
MAGSPSAISPSAFGLWSSGGSCTPPTFGVLATVANTEVTARRVSSRLGSGRKMALGVGYEGRFVFGPSGSAGIQFSSASRVAPYATFCHCWYLGEPSQTNPRLRGWPLDGVHHLSVSCASRVIAASPMFVTRR